MEKENNSFLMEIIMMDSILKENQMDGGFTYGATEINIKVNSVMAFAKDMVL